MFRKASEQRVYAAGRRAWILFLWGLVLGTLWFCGCVHAQPVGAEPAFRVAQIKGVWWFIAPDGKPMFSMGVDCVGPGAEKATYHADRPEYAAFRHYADDTAWATATLARLHAWNFNTLGGWCEVDTLQRGKGAPLPFTQVLHLGGSTQAPWCDLFSDDIARQFVEIARPQIEKYKNDPLLIGWFYDNELGWWSDTLFLYFLKQPVANHTRQVLLGLLRAHYHNDFARLKQDWLVQDAVDFASLTPQTLLTLRPGGRGMEVVNAFTYTLAERYYQIASAAVRRFDTIHLRLGDRYAGYCPIDVARAARNYVDVISTNYGADWTDGANAHSFLEMLHRVTGKPVLITEYYFCAQENRSGNRNSSAGFPTVQTQRERADGFRKQTLAFAALPYVVGAHWFQYYDEPTKGRGDGEDYNMGLVDIADQPYEELTQAAANLNLPERHARASIAAPDSQIPSAPANPLEGLTHWNKTRAYIAGTGKTRSEPQPFADLYACWDAGHLYLAVHAAEFIDPGLYAAGKVPDEERLRWTIVVGDSRRSLVVRFGPDGTAQVVGSEVTLRSWQSATRSTALVALPAGLFGKGALATGQQIVLRVTLTSHSRAESQSWSPLLHLSR